VAPLHATPGRDALTPTVTRRRLGHGVRWPLERRRCLHSLSAPEDRPAVRPAFARDDPGSWLPTASRRVRALPIRLRITLPFALPMSVVLAAMGLFVYLRVGRALLTSIDQNLRAQAGESAGHVERGRS